MYKLLMFDLDGTLVNSAPEITDATNRVLHDLHLPPVTVPQIIGWIGSGSREVMVQAIAYARKSDPDQLRNDAEQVDNVMRAFTTAYEKVCGQSSSLYPSVKETLIRLKALNIPLALITNKEARLTARVLEQHHLQQYFDLVIGGDTLSRTKPDPLPVKHCLEFFKIRPEDGLLIGDSLVDVQAAHAAGVVCWAVPYGYNRGRPIADAKPERIIPDLLALLDVFSVTDERNSTTSEQPQNSGLH